MVSSINKSMPLEDKKKLLTATKCLPHLLFLIRVSYQLIKEAEFCKCVQMPTKPSSSKPHIFLSAFFRSFVLTLQRDFIP